MKRQPTNWEKIFANNATDKGSLPKYMNSSHNSIQTNKKITLSKKGQKARKDTPKKKYSKPIGKEKMFNIDSYSVQFSHSVVSNSFRPHELQHVRPPCPAHCLLLLPRKTVLACGGCKLLSQPLTHSPCLHVNYQSHRRSWSSLCSILY